ncbi:hypothetical protein Tco_0521423, partial [Tanacetum coccineum]
MNLAGTGTEVEAEKRMEVLAALRNIDHIHFFIHGEIPPGCNSSFIALIPKVPD